MFSCILFVSSLFLLPYVTSKNEHNSYSSSQQKLTLPETKQISKLLHCYARSILLVYFSLSLYSIQYDLLACITCKMKILLLFTTVKTESCILTLLALQGMRDSPC